MTLSGLIAADADADGMVGRGAAKRSAVAVGVERRPLYASDLVVGYGIGMDGDDEVGPVVASYGYDVFHKGGGGDGDETA